MSAIYWLRFSSGQGYSNAFEAVRYGVNYPCPGGRAKPRAAEFDLAASVNRLRERKPGARRSAGAFVSMDSPRDRRFELGLRKCKAAKPSGKLANRHVTGSVAQKIISLPVNTSMSVALLSLEMKRVVKQLPGKLFVRNR